MNRYCHGICLYLLFVYSTVFNSMKTFINFEVFQAIPAKGAAVKNFWGFIDETARAIGTPSQNQELYYSGHKRVHFW